MDDWSDGWRKGLADGRAGTWQLGGLGGSPGGRYADAYFAAWRYGAAHPALSPLQIGWAA